MSISRQQHVADSAKAPLHIPNISSAFLDGASLYLVARLNSSRKAEAAAADGGLR